VHVFTALGIDVPVSATELLMGLIEAEISASEMVRGLAVKASGANLVDVKLPNMSRLAGRRLSEVDLPAGDLVVCIVRGGEPVVARPDEVIQASDELIVYSRQLDIEGVRESLVR
jgi:trk system potassium uptake protein TrkA